MPLSRASCTWWDKLTFEIPVATLLYLTHIQYYMSNRKTYLFLLIIYYYVNIRDGPVIRILISKCGAVVDITQVTMY